VLVESLPRMSEADRRTVEENLRARWANTEATDWRSWNLSRSQARYLVETRIATAQNPIATTQR
jgi:hypothetical protein